jgi:tetratricopeptide (TPR) repeat protein
MDPAAISNSPKWPRILALVFLLLWATFWSLGPFFSRTLMALAGYFTFLTFYTSETVRNWLKNLFSGIRPPAAPRFAPRPAFQQAPQPRVEPDAAEIVKKVFRIIKFVILGFASLFVILFFIGVFLVDEETEPAAVETVATSTEQSVSPAEYFTEKGNTALNNGLTDSAHYYYDEALRIDPQYVYALYDKGLAYIQSKDYSRGNALVRRCLRYHSDYDQAWWLLGYSYDKMNNPDSALYCLEQANDRDYSDPGFLELLGEVYEKKGRRGDALEAYQKLIMVDTTKADVYRKLAVLDSEHAGEYLRKAAALEK